MMAVFHFLVRNRTAYSNEALKQDRLGAISGGTEPNAKAGTVRSKVNRAAKYTTGIVLAHLLVNIAHGLAHRELDVGLPPSGSVFVIVVVLILPLVAMALVWTAQKRLGLATPAGRMVFTVLGAVAEF